MKFFKCVLWAVKEYANVGIAVALFLLIGLQIEKQYRSTRYFENCIAQDWTFHSMISGKGYDLKKKEVIDREDLERIAWLCSETRKASRITFRYFKGKTHLYMNEYPNY